MLVVPVVCAIADEARPATIANAVTSLVIITVLRASRVALRRGKEHARNTGDRRPEKRKELKDLRPRTP